MKNQSAGGFTLIEVMFASVYLAIGLLGIAALVSTALGRDVDARRLTIATNLAAEMIERIRFNSPANASSLIGGGYLYHNIQACNYACPGGSTPGNATAANNTTANGDYNQWLGHLSTIDSSGQPILPQAIGTVTSTAVANPSLLGQVQVTVSVQYSTGIRTPTLTLTTMVAPQ
ncbi:MAG TPA: type IV pilus modification protein PilV [Nitrospiraceae bacterium]|nr:type IV pilus modification protein PilV [Nitrospiraceae bacterium]